jgi:hypothetical protein
VTTAGTTISIELVEIIPNDGYPTDDGAFLSSLTVLFAVFIDS